MAPPRHAEVVAAQRLGPDTRLLELRSDTPLGFAGGQFVIVDTGRTLPGGKALKRAYSLWSSDDDQHRFQIAVKRIPGGPCSELLHELPVGATITFSGPWGKLAPAEGLAGRTFVLATDTGITAALGLVRGARFAPLRAMTTLTWLEPPGDPFLPLDLVRSLLPPELGAFHHGSTAPIGDPARIAHARGLLAGALAVGPIGQGFVCGDGAVNYALLDDLIAAGIPATRDSVESFFNMPKKSA